MKLLHTADLHLDSPFCASSPSEAEARRGRQRTILKKIFSLADSEGCDVILIAGDLFDSPTVTPETKELCLSLFANFGKPIFIAPGNHDPFVGGSLYKSDSLPSNVYVFNSNELQYFDLPQLGITVAGYAFLSPSFSHNPLEEEPRAELDNGLIPILCAHTELDEPNSRYAPIMTADIKRHGFAYAALGHVHNVSDTDGNIRYCGFPEGRSFDEQGDGGVIIAEITAEGNVRAERKIISEIRYLTKELSLDGITEADGVKKAVLSELDKLSDGAAVHLRIELTGALKSDVGLAETVRDLAGETYSNVVSLEITDSTLCLPNVTALEKDCTLRGELYRTLKPRIFSEDMAERRVALKALKIGLAAIAGRDVTDGGGI